MYTGKNMNIKLLGVTFVNIIIPSLCFAGEIIEEDDFEDVDEIEIISPKVPKSDVLQRTLEQDIEDVLNSSNDDSANI